MLSPDELDNVVLQYDPAQFGGNESDGNESADATATTEGAANESANATPETGSGSEAGNATAGNESTAGGDGGGLGALSDGGGGVSATQGPRDAGADGGMFGFDVGEYVTEMLVEISEQLTEAFADLLGAMVALIVGTPAPNAIFGAPTNEPWATAYAYYQSDVVTLALLLFVAVIAAIAFAGTVSGILSSYQTGQLWWRAIFGFVFIYFWWPVGAIALQFIDWLARFIAPAPADFVGSTEEVLMGVAGTAVVAAALHTVSTALVIGIAMMYAARFVALLGLMVFMPMFAMLWIVDASMFARISNLASGLMSAFIPLMFLTLPTAILMRVGVFIFQAAGSADWISAPVLMFLSLGTLLASFIAPKFTFSIAQRFMAQSYGAERLSNAIDNQISERKQQAKSWYSDDPEEPPEQPTNPPSGTPAPSAPTSGPMATMGAQAGHGGSHASGGSWSTATGPSVNPGPGDLSPSGSQSATGTPTDTNKYATQDSSDSHRLESRRREVAEEFNKGFE